jgi:hypothetical protein
MRPADPRRWSAWRRWPWRRWSREAASDLALLGGAAALIYGIAQVSHASAWIAGGIIAMASGWILGLSGRDQREPQ